MTLLSPLALTMLILSTSAPFTQNQLYSLGFSQEVVGGMQAKCRKLVTEILIGAQLTYSPAYWQTYSIVGKETEERQTL